MMVRKKNIVFFQISIATEDGGVPRVSDIISKELTSRGYSCFFVYQSKDNDAYSESIKFKADLNIPIRELEASIIEFIKKNNIDIIICQNTYSNTFVSIFKKLKSVFPDRLLFCFLHASPDYWQTYKLKNNKLISLKEKVKSIFKRIIYPIYNPYVSTTASMYKICDRFILLSKSFEEKFIQLYSPHDQANSKLMTIPNPLTFNDYFPQERIIEKEKIAIIVSRLKEDQKKISLALQIWQDLPNDLTDAWKLLIIGSGPDENLYKSYSIKHKLSNVCFLGHQNDVIKYYEKSSIFLMTSIWEGLPMSLLEAQQQGVVSIAFDNFSAVYDVITNDRNGFIIEENNVTLFGQKLKLLMRDDIRRRGMAINAIKDSSKFNVTRIVDDWEKMFTT